MLPLALQIVGLAFAVLMDPYLAHKKRAILMIIITMVISLVMQNYFNYMLSVTPGYRMLRIMNSILGYTIRPVILVMFIRLVKPEEIQWPLWVLSGVNFLVHLTALFSSVCFTISENNHFIRGPLGYTCFVISFVLLLLLVAMSLWEYRKIRRAEAMIPVYNALVIVGAVVLDVYFGNEYIVSFLTAAVICICVSFYIWLHLQFVREHEEALKAEQRIQIMISQIQPHFMYNTFATIQALCRTDPEQASAIVGKFSLYLRQNIDSLSQPNLIPLEKELEHTKIYTDIEMLRFPKIRVEFDIRDSGFSVPALTIQPLVENAIRHGVRVRDKGIVRVSTREEPDAHVLEISDNGKGFDPELVFSGKAPALSDPEYAKRSHIGLTNVRDRVESMLMGSFHVESEIDKGTKITIRIPKQEEKTAGKDGKS